MELAVKWVYQAVTVAGRPMEAGQKPCLCFKGRKYMLAVGAAHPLRVFKRPVDDFHKLRDVMRSDGTRHPIEQAVATLRRLAKTHGITRGAERLLSYAEQQVEGAASAALVDEDEFSNEEEVAVVLTKNDGDGDGDVTSNEAPATGATKSEKELTETKKDKRTKPPAAAAKKGAAKKDAAKKDAAKKGAAKKGAGDTPFRAGTAKEAAFKEYKSKRKEYDALERGDKRAWCETLAKKLGVGAGTISSWIGGDFRRALDR